MVKAIKILFLVCLLYSVSPSQQDVNYSNYNQSIGLQFIIGYNSFDMSAASNYFSEILEQYRTYNINVEEQVLYPANTLWGFGIYYFPMRELEINLNSEFTGTEAASLYGDQFGEIDITSQIDFFSVDAGLRKYFMSVDIIQPFLGINAGIVRAEYSLQEKIIFYDLPDMNRQGSYNYSKYGYKVEAFAGISYNFNYLVVDLLAGYKYSIIPKPESEDFQSDYQMEQVFELENSGFVIKFSLRTGIYW
jgi:hypothetical protein